MRISRDMQHTLRRRESQRGGDSTTPWVPKPRNSTPKAKRSAATESTRATFLSLDSGSPTAIKASSKPYKGVKVTVYR